MVDKLLVGIDAKCDSVFQKREKLLGEMEGFTRELQEYEARFFNPEDVRDFRSMSRVEHVQYVEYRLSLLAGENGNGIAAAARAILGGGIERGEIRDVYQRVRNEIGPRVQVLSKALELYRPTFEAAQEAAWQKLGEGHQANYDRIARKMALALIKFAEVVVEERKFWRSIPYHAQRHVLGASISRIGSPAKDGFIADYLRDAVARGIVKKSELPQEWPWVKELK